MGQFSRGVYTLSLAATLIGAGEVRAQALAKPPTTAPQFEQSQIDAAMQKLRQRQTQRPAGPSAGPSTLPSPHLGQQKTHSQSVAVAIAMAAARLDPSEYPNELVVLRKLEMLQEYNQRLGLARQALRRREILPSDVRDLAAEHAALQQLPLARLRQLMIEADTRNSERLERYREAFGELDRAAATVITILMKSGVVDTAQAMPDDPLSEELELSRGVRRVYYQFILPAQDGSLRRRNGYVEFQLSTSQGLWLPVWADLEGYPIPLFDAAAFVPLRPHRIMFDGDTFVVGQDSFVAPSPLFSLLMPRNPEPAAVKPSAAPNDR